MGDEAHWLYSCTKCHAMRLHEQKAAATTPQPRR
jgi:hypothetical protein